MKRKITSVFIAAMVLFLAYEAWLFAYHNQKSNDNLPGLQSISEMEESDINEIICGYKRTQLNYMWDEPYVTGDDVDIWSLGDDRYLQVNYNNKDEAVITDIFVELFPDDIDKVKMAYSAGTAIESKRILTKEELVDVMDWASGLDLELQRFEEGEAPNEAYAGGEEYVFDINDGEIIGFIGANGAGKSTTIKMMTGIIQPNNGDVEFNGKSIVYDILEAKQQFGYIPDSPDMFLRLTGLAYLNFVCDIYGVPTKNRQENIIRLAEEFKIKNSLNDRIINYSHGMRQKINIIAVLLYNPSVWILDEPMVGLDPEAAYLLKSKMKEHVKKGNTVFFSTHVLEVAESLCDKIIILKHGKILFYGTMQSLYEQKDNESIEKIFIELMENENV